MKSNMKKLAVFVMIAGIAMFSAVAIAWDDDNKWKHGIEGDYAVTGMGSCFRAAADTIDTSTFIIPVASLKASSTTVYEGVYTFYHGGTGKFVGTGRTLSSTINPTRSIPVLDGFGNVIDTDHVIPILPFAGMSSQLEWDFQYTVAADGTISFTNETQTGTATSGPSKGATTYGVGGPLSGKISHDGYDLTVTCGPGPEGAATVIHQYSDSTHQTPTGDALCVINLFGHRQ